MSDEAGFLKAIAGQPAERSSRLVYADWLDEHDRPREAEFLRLQWQIVDLNARLVELGGELDTKWLAAVENLPVGSEWVKLRSGREVLLRNLRQWSFYAGWLVGGPTSEENHASLDQLVSETREREHGLEPYLLQPTECLDQLPEDVPSRRTLAFYPPIACVAEFISFDPARDKDRQGSTLTIIWFQHQFAYPVIEPGIREQIRAIDWEQHAHDFDW